MTDAGTSAVAVSPVHAQHQAEVSRLYKELYQQAQERAAALRELATARQELRQQDARIRLLQDARPESGQVCEVHEEPDDAKYDHAPSVHRVCRSFRNTGHCRFGDDCRMVHSLGDPIPEQTESEPDEYGDEPEPEDAQPDELLPDLERSVVAALRRDASCSKCEAPFEWLNTKKNTDARCDHCEKSLPRYRNYLHCGPCQENSCLHCGRAIYAVLVSTQCKECCSTRQDGTLGLERHHKCDGCGDEVYPCEKVFTCACGGMCIECASKQE